jgi:hypothetical protein
MTTDWKIVSRKWIKEYNPNNIENNNDLQEYVEMK